MCDLTITKCLRVEYFHMKKYGATWSRGKSARPVIGRSLIQALSGRYLKRRYFLEQEELNPLA